MSLPSDGLSDAVVYYNDDRHTPTQTGGSWSPASPAWWRARWRRSSPPTTPCTAPPGSRTPRARDPHEAVGHHDRARRSRELRLRRPPPMSPTSTTCSTSRWRAATTGTPTSPPTWRAPPSSWRATRASTAFFQCSTAGVYESQGHTLLTEAAPLGDSHRAAGMATYSISKIAAEVLVQHTALAAEHPDGHRPPQRAVRRHVRLADVPAHDDRARDGDAGVGGPSHHLLAAAPRRHRRRRSPTCWGRRRRLRPSSTGVATRWWRSRTGARSIAELIGDEVAFEPSPSAIPSIPLDVSRLNGWASTRPSAWRDGIRRMVETLRPELVSG